MRVLFYCHRLQNERRFHVSLGRNKRDYAGGVGRVIGKKPSA